MELYDKMKYKFPKHHNTTTIILKSRIKTYMKKVPTRKQNKLPQELKYKPTGT